MPVLVLRNEIIVVEKGHPHHEKQHRKNIFVLQPGKQAGESFHAANLYPFNVLKGVLIVVLSTPGC
jgi:hypothetical protein